MNELSMAYSEVYSILCFIDEYYLKKISSKFIEYIYKKKDDNYNPLIDMSIPLEEQNLLDDTINILALIKYNYWCENEQDKEELLQILNENEKEYQIELHEKYNPDDVFKNNKNQLSKVKESLFNRLINKIKSILKIRK